MIEVGLVGPGRVGRTLTTLLPRERFHLGPVLSHTLTSARRSVRLMEIGEPADDPEALAYCDLLLVTVPDHAIEAVANRLAAASFRYTKKVVLHTNGLLSSAALEPLRQRGAAAGSMHPFYVFQRPVLSLAGVYFAVEGDTAATSMARALIRAWDAEFQLVKPAEKPRHVMASSMVSDLLTGLLEASVQEMASGGFNRRRALEALTQMLQVVLKDYTRSGRASRPGPLLRGEMGRALEALGRAGQVDAQVIEDYRVQALRTLRVLRHESVGPDLHGSG